MRQGANRGAGAVFRTIPSKVLTMEDLDLGQVFKDISMVPRGLVLVTGPTDKMEIIAQVLEEDGYHFIRVTFSPNSNVGTPVNFYLLTLHRDYGTADDLATSPRRSPSVGCIQ